MYNQLPKVQPHADHPIGYGASSKIRSLRPAFIYWRSEKVGARSPLIHQDDQALTWAESTSLRRNRSSTTCTSSATPKNLEKNLEKTHYKRIKGQLKRKTRAFVAVRTKVHEHQAVMAPSQNKARSQNKSRVSARLLSGQPGNSRKN